MQFKNLNYGRTNLNPNIISEMLREELSPHINYIGKDGRPCIYCDYTATTPILGRVMKVVDKFNQEEKTNVHRGIYERSLEASERYENVHNKIADLFGADYGEIVFVGHNATTALNQIVYSLFNNHRRKGKGNIVLSVMNHSSNIMPWMNIAKAYDWEIRWIDITPDDYKSDLNQAERLIDKDTKVVAVTHASNVTGAIDDIKPITEIAHKKGAIVVVDGVQAAPHLPINAKELDCDFWVASAHKMFAPNVGIIYGKGELLEKMGPYIVGGGTPLHIEPYKYFLAPVPDKFEAGTPDIGNVIGLGALVDFLGEMGQKVIGEYDGKLPEDPVNRRKYLKIAMEAIKEHERNLSDKMIKGLLQIPNLILYGPKNPEYRVPTFSINVGEMHSDQLAMLLNGWYKNEFIPIEKRLELRSGCHCAYLLVKKLTGENIKGTARISLGCVNNEKDVDEILEIVDFVARKYGHIKRDDSMSRKLKALKRDFEERVTKFFLSPYLKKELYEELLSLQDKVLTYKYIHNVEEILNKNKLPPIKISSERKMKKELRKLAIDFAKNISKDNGIIGFERAIKDFNYRYGFDPESKPWCYSPVKKYFMKNMKKNNNKPISELIKKSCK